MNLRKLLSDADEVPTLIESLQYVADSERGLAMDMVAQAGSGHLGLALGCAEIGAALFGYLLQLDPSQPRWVNRDRFVLSAGHGSAWLYSWLYLLGFKIPSLETFRQKGGLPGHPEFGVTPGVECTTGPLGQGIGNAVGLAVSGKIQQERAPGGEKILDYHVVCLCGDGCLQEGVSHEACAFAGHTQLDNFILIYDANAVTLDGSLDRSQSEDTAKRFEAYGFFVQTVDGHDLNQFMQVYECAKAATKPSLIIAKTVIGKGLPEIEGMSKAHGEAGVKCRDEFKKALGLPPQEFCVDERTRLFFARRQQQLQKQVQQWQENYQKWVQSHPQTRLTEARFQKKKKIQYSIDATEFDSQHSMATRTAGGVILNQCAQQDECLITGSADVVSSAKNQITKGGVFSKENYAGRNIAFGVREHAMGAIMNGIAYDGVFRVSGSSFLAFTDYLRPAIRVAAMAKLPVTYIFTHDSVAVGQDGPTHQPVEILSSLRAIPNLDVVRPGDAGECIGAYEYALNRMDGPVALILSRQELPILPDIEARARSVVRGAYIIKPETEALQLIIIATGSELSLALEAAESFPSIRVVSMPSMEIFERQPSSYKEQVLPNSYRNRLIVEAGIAMPWYRYVEDGTILSIESFGFSAPGKEVLEAFGFSRENVTQRIRQQLGQA
ncbi:MAG: transketolase [Opitutales bacterium]|nr:transketolase [Opitutales bacterium]